MGKGKSSSALEEAQEHQSRPLATLKDPNAFGPPPKHINYHGGIAAPNTITPDTRGWGAPLNMDSIRAKEEEEKEAQAAREAEEQEIKPPPGPFKVDTTGLSTRDLPKPPIRRAEQGTGNNSTGPAAGSKPKPSLPPRLPPRQNSGASVNASSPPPSYNAATIGESPAQNGYLNQGALNRLGATGVSVPGLGIGRDSESTNPWRDQRSSLGESQSPSSSSSRLPGINELQGRFSKMSPPSTASGSSSQGTTFAQKQAALKTANSFRNDPSSISLSDARNAASTANNFRERHGDQVASGWQGANDLNKKYGVMDRLNSSSPGIAIPSQQSFGSTSSTPVTPGALSTDGKKKAPPPPPPKKKLVDQASVPGPPPIPLSSKPRV